MLISRFGTAFFPLIFILLLSTTPHAQEKIENPPLVLGVPGFLVPGVKFTQEEHFGNAKELLAKQGIPFQAIVYDSKEYPLNVQAGLASMDDYSIAFSRVGPAILRAVADEKVKRLKEGKPPLKEVVLFMYSQGGVISYNFVRKFYYWKKKYAEWEKTYGQEWEVLRKDPEFIYLTEAMSQFHDMYSILVQREQNFYKDPNLMRLFQEGMDELNRRIDVLLAYLRDPTAKYSSVSEYESPFYPKRYRKFAELAEKLAKTRGQNKEIFDFIMDYSIFKGLLDVDFRFFSSAASFFGSPKANVYYGLMQVAPISGFFSASAISQIRDTQLGSAHHESKLENLARESKFSSFILNNSNVVFVVGVDGVKGDGLIDQPSAHLSQHTFMEFDLKEFKRGAKKPADVIEPQTVVLPDWPRLALPLSHFKESGLVGHHKYGAAYMEEGSPAYEALMDFLRKDYKGIEALRERYHLPLSQFMVEFFVETGRETKNSSGGTPFFLIPFKIIGGFLYAINPFIKKSPIEKDHVPEDIRFDGQFFNPDASTYVWVGHFERERFKNLSDQPSEEMIFRLDLPGYERVKVKIPIRAGTISFAKVIAEQ